MAIVEKVNHHGKGMSAVSYFGIYECMCNTLSSPEYKKRISGERRIEDPKTVVFLNVDCHYCPDERWRDTFEAGPKWYSGNW